MKSCCFFADGLALAPTALIDGQSATTAQPLRAVPTIGLGKSARVPHGARLAGEGVGYARTGPAAALAAESPMPKIRHGAMGGGR